ncbi:MAG: dTDP-4-dehydrorhamnose reductase [Paludibacteraceae bacterium]|nr:dTDP-4-dehydrorhamnose reductase [Paludibacteraceae bacterium]
MRNILVTGANGQLGNEIRILTENNKNYNVFLTDVDTLDICDYPAVESFVSNNKIDMILNCAAYTAVDKAEDNEEICRKVNALAPYNLAKAAAKFNIGLIHISTDYVFDGTSCTPYTEDMEATGLSVYGKTKREGELKIFETLPTAVVIRTAWLYSEFGNNFVKTMIRLGNERDKLGVVFDQIGTPTYALDLAGAMITVMEKSFEKGNIFGGIYHFTNEGVCSWYDFTIKIHELAGIKNCKVSPIESKDYPAKAPRPSYSVLNKAKIKNTFGIEIPHWEESLVNCVRNLQS